MFLQQPKPQENLFSPAMNSSPMTISSMSSWRPINASPSEDMWELPASSSSMSDDRDDFHTSGLHQEFSMYSDNDDYKTNTIQEQDTSAPMPPTVSFRTNTFSNGFLQDSSSTVSNTSSRSRNSGIGLSKQRCVLGDTTNTIRRKSNASSTAGIQRSYFHWTVRFKQCFYNVNAITVDVISANSIKTKTKCGETESRVDIFSPFCTKPTIAVENSSMAIICYYFSNNN